MFDSIARASLTVSIRDGSYMDAGDAESSATKLLEVGLRQYGITWGPVSERTLLPFGARTTYYTIEPELRVEVDTITRAHCSIATIWLVDHDQEFLVPCALEEALCWLYGPDRFQQDLVITIGRSHPESGQMVEHVTALNAAILLASRRRADERWTDEAIENGVLTDEDGTPIWPIE